jgi:SAM-dependent methyltransferase
VVRTTHLAVRRRGTQLSAVSPPDPHTDLPPDRRAHREWLVSLAGALPDGRWAGRAIVDLGCGRGDDLRLLAERFPGPDARLIGLDVSAAALAAAAAATADPRVSFGRASLDGPLPFADALLDVVYSHNVLECLRDPGAFAREVARVLRPGGRVVVGHWDWDSQLFDGADKSRVRRLVAAYADWQQAWMANADGWTGRRLWGVFTATGAFDGVVHARVLTNTAYAPPGFGYENARAMGGLARRGLASPDDVERFLCEQEALHAAGRYVYSVTGFAYVGVRVSA